MAANSEKISHLKAPAHTIRRALALLAGPEQVIEIRALKTARKTVRGYFNDQAAAAQAAAQWNGKAPAVYMTLNQVDPALLARAANRMEPYAESTTTDKDIVRRLWLPLDFDPKRPAGISSTDIEHEAAIEAARSCRDWLTTKGWAAPILADSGNGGHLLYAIDLPNDDESRALVNACLKVLAKQFDDEAVSLDQTVGNAARIWKVYGTMACKGDNVAERPHRQAKILEAPDAVAKVTREQLEALAALAPAEPKPEPKRYNGGDRFDIDDWISRHGLNVKPAEPWQGGRKWVFPVCPWNPDHTNHSAYLLEQPSGAIAAGCHHNGCHGKSWADLRELFEPGNREKRQARAERQQQRPHVSHGTQTPPLSLDELERRYQPKSAADLMRRQFDPVKWAIPGIIPEGVTILAGSPKIGKSWLSLGLAVAVATGGVALGDKRVEAGDVLYLGLEDSERRLCRRLKMVCPDGNPGRLEYHEEWPRLDSGGAELLDRWLANHPEARLVIIDTLEKARPRGNSKDSAYTNDYLVGNVLTPLAKKYAVSIVLVHHVRKMQTDDPLEQVSGTLGLTGGVDGVMVLRRSRGQADALLYVTGRDVEEEQDYALDWDQQSATWTLKGSAEEYKHSAERFTIIKLLEMEPMTPKQLADELHKNRSTVRNLLAKMVEDGVVERRFDGKYQPNLKTQKCVDSIDSVDSVDGVDSVDSPREQPSVYADSSAVDRPVDRPEPSNDAASEPSVYAVYAVYDSAVDSTDPAPPVYADCENLSSEDWSYYEAMAATVDMEG